MAGMLRVPRSRGALSGVLLVLLGAWGALIPFIGPYFHYAFTPDQAWTYNTDRLWLEVLPGVAVLLGGLIALVASTRPTAVFGAWLAALGGAWFVVGRPLSTLWTTGAVVAGGRPVGGTVIRAAENIGFFAGLGVVVLFFAAMALGRFTVIGAREVAAAAEEAAPATETLPAAETVPVRDRVPTADLPRRTPVTTDGAAPAATQSGSRWRPFARHAADTAPADSEPAAGAAPVATGDRQAGKHSAE
jgi:hypothetical protein